MPRKRHVNEVYDPVLSATVSATDFDELVYLLVANRPYKYDKGSSRIVYVGTTTAGMWRVLSSASEKIHNGRGELHGFRRLDAYIIWSSTRKGPKSYKKKKIYKLLERAVLISFREKYGSVPILNKQGKNIEAEFEFDVFFQSRIDTIVARYG